MKKRIIGILLCVVMVCSLLPIEVFALPSNTIFLDYNGGTLDGETSFRYSVPSYISDTCDVPNKTPVLEGYIFDGWNTEKDGSGVAYSVGDTYTFTTSSTTVTLYAQWKLPNWIDYADTSWYDSDRSADSYTISTAEQLAGLAKLVNSVSNFEGKTVKLADNINLAGKQWTPIGIITPPTGCDFSGTFDGDGYTVSGLYIYAPESNYQALFGLVNEGAAIKNLRVSGSVTGKEQIAGIVADALGAVIENCVNDCTVAGKSNVGGIVGSSNRSLILNCLNTAEISASVSLRSFSFGGIVGNNGGFVSNCYNIGDVSGTGYVGGIAGQTDDTAVSYLPFDDPAILAKCVSNIYNCYNIGSVKGKDNTSGICGLLMGTASSCYNLGILEASEEKVYAIANTLEPGTEKATDCYYLSDCNASGNRFLNNLGTALSSENFRKKESFSGFDFNTTWEMGPLAPTLKCFDNKGTNDNPYPIANLEMLEYMRDSVNSGDDPFYASFILLRDIDLGCDNNNQWVPIGTETNAFLASLNGKGHIITGLYINKPDQDYVGFIGKLGVGFTIKNLGVYGTVIGKNYVGGIAGFAYSQFENCFNACDVTGNSYVAGISGQGGFSTFLDCYNMGNITCIEDYCGGITTDPYYTNIYHCYNIGTIDCEGVFVDPIAKEDVSENDFKSCYYLSGCNAEGTVFGTVDGVSALSESDFADKSQFTGWDFDNTWDLSDTTVKRPLLKNAAEKGTSLNPFKVVYTDDKGGVAINEVHYVTYNQPTPSVQINISNMISWRFVKWDKTIAANVTGDVIYTAKITNKASNILRYHANETSCDVYWNSATGTINPRKEFKRDGFEIVGWNTLLDGTGTTYKLGDTFTFIHPHNGEIYNFYAVWQANENPVFVGLEDNEYYCYSVKFKVTDNGGIASVKVGNTTLTADKDGYYTINYPDDQFQSSVDYTVTATDLAGNVTSVSITLRGSHAMGAWGKDDEYIWRACNFCGEPDDTKYKLPIIDIVGDDTVCKGEDYKFTIALPSEWYFGEPGINSQLQADGTYLCVVENNNDAGFILLKIELMFNPGDVRPYIMEINKTVAVVDHKGGTANCKDKAICTECGRPYGETDPKNHKEELKHLDAKPATVEKEGNIDCWYCSACDKYYADKDGNTEISNDEAVLKKLAPEITDGNSQKVTAGENKELTFRSNAAFADFIRVEVDGVTLDESNYTAKSGSIVVTLKASYVSTLSVGEHTLSIVSAGGTATASFTVEAANVPSDNTPSAPATGDSSNVSAWFALMLASLTCFTIACFFKKRKTY